jgi:hypothetical protein
LKSSDSLPEFADARLTVGDSPAWSLDASGVTPGSPKFNKAKEQMILTRLDAWPKKPAPAPEPPLAPPMSSFARGPSVRHAR